MCTPASWFRSSAFIQQHYQEGRRVTQQSALCLQLPRPAEPSPYDVYSDWSEDDAEEAGQQDEAANVIFLCPCDCMLKGLLLHWCLRFATYSMEHTEMGGSCGALQMPEFPELLAAIESAIDDLGGCVAPKLNWSAPHDAAWVSSCKSLACRNADEVSRCSS